MIGFSSPTVDANGSMAMRDDKTRTRLNQAATRASRAACLDLTSYIENSGVCDGDRTFLIVIKDVATATYDFVVYLRANYTTAKISCREGFFSGIIKNIMLAKGALTVTFWVNERLDE